jgi:DNA-binding FadR family transcriptional regulator
MERADQTLTKLRQMIAGGDFNGTGRIPPERALAGDLGVGRRSLRRALDILEQEGRISRHQGRGTFINGHDGREIAGNGANAPRPARNGNGRSETPVLAIAHLLDHTSPMEVIEVRLAIEPVMARLASFRASQAEIHQLQALAAETRTAGDPATYEKADALFHRTIAEIAQNRLYLAVFDTIHAGQRDQGWRRLGENAHCFKRQSVYADFHAEISAAIAARQGEKAHDLMHRHLSDVQRYINEHAFPGPAVVAAQ